MAFKAENNHSNDPAPAMSSRERVLAAFAFQRPDRIPCFDGFWDFPAAWRAVLGDPQDLSDIAIWYPNEATFPSRARRLKEEGGYRYEVDQWGRVVRHPPGAYFVETLEVPLPEGCDLAKVIFDSPELNHRYLMNQPDAKALARQLAAAKARHCVFGKTGGPFLRSVFVRGEAQFLMDMAADPPLARAIADKVADHLMAVGLQAMRRWNLQETGIWIYDDMAYNRGPMFSPAQFEQILLPAYRRMIRAYKNAGARYVVLHSDGDIRPLLDMLVEAGIDGLNPLEQRAGMDMAEIRRRYPRLVLIGGMDNTDTLINGPIERICAEARTIIDLGREGGVIIGAHSISPEVPLDHFVKYRETCLTYGNYSRKEQT